MRELSRDYAKEVIEDEWPSQAETGKGSSKARKAIGDMYRAFGDGTINAQVKKDYPFICSTLMQSITDVTSKRDERNIQANESVPPIMWGAALAGGLVIVTMCFFLFMERGLPHMLMAGAMASLIGFLLYTCLIMSHPFSGPLAISAESFENTLVVFDDVDKGN